MVDLADAVELGQRAPWRDHLVDEVGVHDSCCGEVLGHHGLDHRGEHAQRDVAAHTALGEVVDGAKPEEVLQDPKAPLDALQRPVVADDLGRRGLLGRERGRDHVAPGEQLGVVGVGAPGRSPRGRSPR